MDPITVILIVQSITLAYQLLHYLVRKLASAYKYRTQQNNGKNVVQMSSDESDKDAITEIHV